MDIGGWLRSLGLGQYEGAFRDNEIDEAVLPKLTQENLKELGVTALGHRLKLLDAIAALHAETRVMPSRNDASAVSAAPNLFTGDQAERRQVTVMFSDLVGSTALSANMDPEDLREVISTYHKCVAETVHRFDGFVAKYMGDGVLVYFGYPQAHEDDSERAVRTGLELIAAVTELKTHAVLQTRVGIATGLVVVGDLIGSGEAQERGIVGETPNLAARLQGIAEADTVVIAESTRRLIGDLFELRDLGKSELKGIAAPVQTWAVQRARSVESRFEALHASGFTALVGRDEETELLLRRWARAKSGEGRVVLISGEPGIGKSRLTAALFEHIGTEPNTRLRYFCAPHHQDSALYPFIVQLEHAAGLARDDTVEAKLGKLRALLAPGSRNDNDITLLNELLSLPNTAADLNLSPQRKREKLFDALLNQLEAEARRRPVLMVFEDAHWIDPTSRELLDFTVDRVRHLPVLLAITFRPEFQPPWSGRAHVTSLALNRLGERDGEALVQTLAGNAALTPEIVAEIVERTDGVPLFVEELTKAVLESATQSDRVALGLCLFTAKGALAAKPAHTRALELAESSGEPQQRFEALYGVWQSTRDNVSGGIAAAVPLSERLLRMAERDGDDGLRLQAHHSGWTTWFHAGDPAKTREHADAGRLLYDPEKHASHRLVYGGHDPGVCAQISGAWAESLLGYPDNALASISKGLALAERIAHPFTLGFALLFSSQVYLNRCEPERALRHLDAAEAVAAEQRLSFNLEPGMLRGAALLGQGAVDEAIACIREGVAKWTRLGRTLNLPFGLAFLAEGLARRGDRAAALAALREGLEIADATGEHKWDAELHRLTGTVLLAENKRDEGQASLQQAIRIAQAQQAKSLELRAATGLARLWGEQGRRSEARELLAPVYGWFTEGFDTLDLKEAKVLLGELQG